MNVNAHAQPPSITTKTNKKIVTLEIPGMHCPTCPFTVRKSLKEVDGVLDIKVSSQDRTASVTYDPTKTSVKKLIETTTKVGYPSTVRHEN